MVVQKEIEILIVSPIKFGKKIFIFEMLKVLGFRTEGHIDYFRVDMSYKNYKA